MLILINLHIDFLKPQSPLHMFLSASTNTDVHARPRSSFPSTHPSSEGNYSFHIKSSKHRGTHSSNNRINHRWEKRENTVKYTISFFQKRPSQAVYNERVREIPYIQQNKSIVSSFSFHFSGQGTESQCLDNQSFGHAIRKLGRDKTKD